LVLPRFIHSEYTSKSLNCHSISDRISNCKNQGLRGNLGLDDDSLDDPTPHRAMGDVQVTSGIMVVCLERYVAQGGVDDVASLIREISTPRLLTHCPLAATVASSSIAFRRITNVRCMGNQNQPSLTRDTPPSATFDDARRHHKRPYRGDASGLAILVTVR
jgi:hypothetical protein